MSEQLADNNHDVCTYLHSTLQAHVYQFVQYTLI